MDIVSLDLPNNLVREVLSFILEMRTLRLREVKQLVKDGTGRTWQSWDLTLDCEIPKSMLFHNIRGTSTMDP